MAFSADKSYLYAFLDKNTCVYGKIAVPLQRI